MKKLAVLALVLITSACGGQSVVQPLQKPCAIYLDVKTQALRLHLSAMNYRLHGHSQQEARATMEGNKLVDKLPRLRNSCFGSK